MEPIKDAFRRLIRFGHAAKERAMPVWKVAVLRSEPALQWLKLQFSTALQWLRLRPRVAFWTGLALVLILGFVIGGGLSWYGKHHAALAPLLTLVAGVSVAAVALIRHFAQTDADRQRRITESFSKAVEQLGSDRLEVRLGGIYSLERISKESPDDYWTVMENLTALVREHSRRNEAERTSQDLEQRISRRAYFLWQEAGQPDGRADDFWAEAAKQEEFGEPPATDIAAVLTVIKRRSEQSREREGANDWYFDLSGAILKQCDLWRADLKGANLNYAHLEGANLIIAHLEKARLWDTHLEGARLTSAHLEEAQLYGAHLERANLMAAHLEGAHLIRTHLERANLVAAHLEGAHLTDAHLEGANLRGATGLSEAQLRDAYGDPATKLPEGMHQPTLWPVEGT